MTNENFKYNVFVYDDLKRQIVLKDIFNECSGCSVSFVEHFNTQNIQSILTLYYENIENMNFQI